MVNAMELLSNYRQAESQIVARQQAMRIAQAEEARNAMLFPYKTQALQSNMMRDQAAVENQRNALAFQRQQADVRNQLMLDQMTSRNSLMREQMASRERIMANRPKAPGQVIQTDDGVYERGADGVARPITGPDGKVLKPKGADKPLTEFQGKSAGYGSRAQNSHDILQEIEGDLFNVGAANAKRAIQDVPVIGGIAGAAANMLLPADAQRIEQAQRDFVNAVLRQESGAAISAGEFQNAAKQYFPQPGDDKKTIEQKRRNRELAIEGFERSAGKDGGEPIRRLREEGRQRRAGQGGNEQVIDGKTYVKVDGKWFEK